MNRYHITDAASCAEAVKKEDGGERIDYKGWKEALKYLNQEHFVQDYELRQVKEEVCRMEVVKRKFIKENKQKKSDRYEHR